VRRLDEVKTLTKEVFESTRIDPTDFKNLLNKLLTITIVAEGQKLVLGGPKKAQSGFIANYIEDKPLLLNNDKFLKFVMQYKSGKGQPLTILYSCFQYQCDEDRHSKRFIFRYDYDVEPDDELHPVAHLQINGELREKNIIDKKLEDIRFPVVRPSVESLIILLIDGFGLKPNDTTGEWREALKYSEAAFRKHQAKKLVY
jgi:hypothetical protein